MLQLQHFFRFLLRLYYPLIISLGFLVFLLGLRILITGSLFYSFLIWNLFLATVPYVITQVALFHDVVQTKKHIKFIVFALWLAFLPNAPYLITDLVHLHNSSSSWTWFDLFMVFAFACNGLLLYALTVTDAIELLSTIMAKKWVNVLVFTISILSGYGIYLGRFLRFNSWDILIIPYQLMIEVFGSFTYPYTYLMTLAFGLFIWIFLLIFKWVKQ